MSSSLRFLFSDSMKPLMYDRAEYLPLTSESSPKQRRYQQNLQVSEPLYILQIVFFFSTLEIKFPGLPFRGTASVTYFTSPEGTLPFTQANHLEVKSSIELFF